jgi:hypothetical protein
MRPENDMMDAGTRKQLRWNAVSTLERADILFQTINGRWASSLVTLATEGVQNQLRNKRTVPRYRTCSYRELVRYLRFQNRSRNNLTTVIDIDSVPKPILEFSGFRNAIGTCPTPLFVVLRVVTIICHRKFGNRNWHRCNSKACSWVFG